MESLQDLDQIIARHKVFIRNARDVSRQSLFFLGILTQTNCKKIDLKLGEFSHFAMVKVRAFVNGVNIPKKYFSKQNQPNQPPHIQRILDQFDFWQRNIRDKANGIDSLELDQVQDLRENFVKFLKLSREPDLTGKLIYYCIPMARRIIKRHLYFFIGAILVAVAMFSVDAVKNLIVNEGSGVLYPLIGIVITYGLTGIFYFYVPLFRIGNDAFYSIRAASPSPEIPRWPEGNTDIQDLIFHKLWISAALVVLLLIVYGQILISLLGSNSDLIGESNLTVYSFFSLAFVFLLLCHYVDIWDFFDSRPVRLWALAMGALFLAFSIFTTYGRQAAIIILLVLSTFAIVSIKRYPKKVVNWFVTFALLTSIVFLIIGWNTINSDVWRESSKRQPLVTRITPVEWPYAAKNSDISPEWPYAAKNSDISPVVVMAASGGGSRAAFYTAQTLEKLHEEFPRIAAKLNAISSVSGGSLATAAYVSRRYRHFIENSRSHELSDLTEAVSQDFLQPTLRGALVPGKSRGRCIEEEWRSGLVKLKGIHISQLVDGWKKASDEGLQDPPYPLPLFNTCSLDGHDVVISPLSREAYQNYDNSPIFQDSSNSLTWVFYRDGIYGLEEFLPNFDPPISSAVRASANFPFGFPLVQIETTRSLRFNPCAEKRISGQKKIIKLTDGGVLSNSGLWSLFSLLMNDKEKESKRVPLQQRGVLLIVVEASKMPEYRDNRRSISSLYGTIGDSNPMGQAMHKRMYEILASKYGSKLAVVQVDLKPESDKNVLTTWALDNRSLESLQESFKDSWEREKQFILKKWQSIQKRRSFPAPYIPATNRPPLS